MEKDGRHFRENGTRERERTWDILGKDAAAGQQACRMSVTHTDGKDKVIEGGQVLKSKLELGIIKILK